MNSQITDINDVKSRLGAIDARLSQEIETVNRKLEADISLIQQAAAQEIDKLKQTAENNREQEVNQATRQIESQTQILISQIQDI